ncbi:hypothetical protein [Kitasatospora sp. A2-31]|uniref:hypothetical protein n=1 Tax=Kitasatospora sp. A2-31 TaxID=2916414 RepID=UPI001EE88743|nr:hypothetical protein [Kitasatospora sp. A2-31]MCG6493412.1 hypothetical protein [Kitasatospora sp. A2-31]
MIEDFETWWDGAADEERQEFLDGCLDLDDTPTYPPWWRRPWPVWRETAAAEPLPDLATYQLRTDA